MPDPTLNVSPDLQLPLDAVTQTFLIFGKKGSGKTATAGVFAEEMIGAGLPVAVLDPMGAWWGLRSSADGKGNGLPVVIIGGEHADLPLTHDAGAQVADLIVEEHVPVVVDLFLMSKTQQRHFVTEFMERLFHRNRDPLHLIIDEADRWAPQRGTHDMARLLGAYEDIVLRGRRLGLGSTSITLRTAQLHAAIRSQVECLVAMRMLGKLDVQAIDEWVRLHATEDEAATLKASLPSLPTGTAWFWSPGWLELMAKVQVRPRWTFDSSATPKVGEQRIAATLADIDLTAIGARMASVVQRAEQDDPRALRKRIAELERKQASHADPAALESLRLDNELLRAELAAALARPAERIEVPAFRPGDLEELDRASTAINVALQTVVMAMERVRDAQIPGAAQPAARPRQPARTTAVSEPGNNISRPHLTPDMSGNLDRARAVGPAANPAGGRPLGRAERKILAVLAQFPDGRTRIQLAMLAVYSSKSSGYSNALGALRSAGLINRGEPIMITPEGLDAIGDDWEPLPAGEALVEHWMQLLGKAERTILRCLLDAFPGSLTRDELAAAADYSPASSGYSNALGKLRSLNLINKGGDIMADPDFAREVGRG